MMNHRIHGRLQIFVVHLALSMCAVAGAARADGWPSFAKFEARAKAGERLTIVFFGASLTWGANATDQANTSYRARIADYFEAAYPQAHFKYYDAAIGGTGSMLGVFRLERDVLKRQPDLVFLDFTANDDIYSDSPEPLASYESLVRRIIAEGRCPVVQMIFPFGWNVKYPDFEKMKRRTAHLAISDAYGTSVGDAVALAVERVQRGEATIEQIWPYDQVHPGDFGYQLFADAAWEALQAGIRNKLVCKIPETMLHADTYMTNARVRISTLAPLPEGWRVGHPNLTAAWHDGLMSRWLDDVAIAANTVKVKGEGGKDEKRPQAVGRLAFRIRATTLLLFGEETPASGKYRVWIDGKAATFKAGDEERELFEANATRYGGNRQHAQIVATGLDPDVEHRVEIEPVFASEKEQELRLESICVAGGQARLLRNDEQ